MPPINIASRMNPRVKQLRAAFAGQARLSGGLIAIEGEHLLYEAVRSGLAIKTVFISEGIIVPEWVPRSIELVELTRDAFTSAVDTQSPQGIAALFVPPLWNIDTALDEQSRASIKPLFLIAAALQDPGNLGTLVRSAEAFGATAVMTTPGTVSAWNQKAVRASAGSVFRMPVVSCALEDIAALKLRGIRLYAAAADTGASSLLRADFSSPCALMIGNEGAGLSADLLALADERISIPMPGGVESLNAAIAGSLLLYEASRRRAASHAASDLR